MRLLESNVTANAPHVRKAFVNQAIDYSGSGRVEFRCAQDYLRTSLAAEGQGPLCRTPAVKLSELVSQNMPGSFQLQMDIEGAGAGVFLSESTAVVQRCYQVLVELHDTVLNGQRLLVEDILQAAQDVHGLRLVDRYGPVALLRPSRHSCLRFSEMVSSKKPLPALRAPLSAALWPWVWICLALSAARE